MMLEILIWFMVAIVFLRLFRNVTIITRRNKKPSAQPQPQGGRKDTFSQIEDADYEDITHKPDGQE